MPVNLLTFEEVESMTPEELAAPTPCPDGVPQDAWDDAMKENETYTQAWKDAVAEHVRNYDREQSAK